LTLARGEGLVGKLLLANSLKSLLPLASLYMRNPAFRTGLVSMVTVSAQSGAVLKSPAKSKTWWRMLLTAMDSIVGRERTAMHKVPAALRVPDQRHDITDGTPRCLKSGDKKKPNRVSTNVLYFCYSRANPRA